PSWEGQRGGLTVSASDRNPPRLSGTPPKEGIKLNTFLTADQKQTLIAELDQFMEQYSTLSGIHYG
ncbi:MAG: hypothetical protein AAGC54_12425, partial [Cyanobacteria bacterium P01_F01_bin.4]